MDNREKIYEHGGELGNVQDLFEITANHVHYRGRISEEDFLEAISGLEPSKRELIISMTSGIESRLRKTK